ncbi:short-subunit dehydrogenase [Allocatelliglobosispora scoriae]|uniref:Short-subunit dehydrogenase n=1 Tax=Allocatelliglobosispora scoriae TaxID=643052 RepID=A0A841BT64_9ACTN|nr:SDR family oxidoreductase [Allocatelliglobosispora scoriae]MBB5870895.1 short-subunit dehydrogenase [Allocatelliglobosispora scoriae]
MAPSNPGTALITGATAGIGATFAHHLARAGQDLVLVARDGERLDAVAAELTGRHSIKATTLVADLTTDEGLAAVERVLREQRIDLLVNNAGLSLNKSFLRSTLEEEMQLMRLNVLAVLHLTDAALPAMLARGSGEIINVSSVSGFAATMPGSTYPASKAWVTSFSEAVGMASRSRGVRVMALCPGFTRTEFHQRAGISTGKMPDFLWLQADDVVEAALRDLRKGKLVSVPSVRYKVAVTALKLTPRSLLHRFSARGASRLGRTVGDSQ